MRVAIVNDLAMAREALKRALAHQPGIQIAWTAADGAEAVAKARDDRPDLILMDLIMPGVDGVEATRQIMRQCPCAIVVVTATVEGNASRVYDAMSAGALDAVDTPRAGAPDGAAALIQKIERVRSIGKAHGCGGMCDDATAPAPRAPAASAPAPAPAPAPTPAHARSPVPALPPCKHSSGHGAGGASAPILAIGASTGGPQAVATVLNDLPNPAPFAVLVVQHMGHTFLPGLASWLSERTGRAVRLARPGDVPAAGDVLIAGEPRHMVVYGRGTVCFSDAPTQLIHRPSVDVLFASLGESDVEPGVAVLLTGMGRDGAAGMAALRERGWATIAQDRATSVVWGMPGAAADMGAASQVLPLDRIGAAAGTAMSGLRAARAKGPR